MGQNPEVPSTPLTDPIRVGNQYPATITTVAAEGVSQRLVFDPSMKHHDVALRASDPQFAEAGQGERWYAARRAAMAAALAAVAGSEFVDALVLRGSILLKTWFGDAAREPGDLDFVVDAAGWTLPDPRTERLFDEIASGAEEAARGGGVVKIHASAALSDEIWTYDRVPGRRLVLPWSAEGCPDGSIQLDFVFGEKLPAPPEPVEIAADGGTPAVVLAATRELSLAWKLLWLVSDAYPQGKDLYDAVLLAESTPLSFELLRDAFCADGGEYVGRPVTMRSIRSEIEDIDWSGFELDYPDFDVDDNDMRQRLLTAIEPTFLVAGVLPSEYQQRVRWLAPLIERCRLARSGGGPEKVHKVLLRNNARFGTAIIVTRELDESKSLTVEEAAQEALASSAWQGWIHGILLRNPQMVTKDIEDVRAAELNS
ncbi:MAG: nucleotidyl transferase AbiEii/AbiGii toxin family protein [Catenulispora sp.]|nr:nucleotidyl transferase AbiEii/AbiGii toxin family protein [Catenulispora sp.]